MKIEWFVLALGVGLVGEGGAQPVPVGLWSGVTNLTGEPVEIEAVRAPAWSVGEARPLVTLETQRAQAATNGLAGGGPVQAGRTPARRIEPVPGGARADFGRHRVTFSANAAHARALRLTTPLGQELACRATCLALRDAASGRSAVLGQVRSRVGLIRPPDQVLYTNVFGAEGLRADLRLTYAAPWLEQDLILREWPVLPADVPLANLRLEVWTEWFGAAPMIRDVQPLNLRQTLAEEAPLPADDEVIEFAGMRIVSGQAFALPEGKAVPVAKAWVVTGEGRSFLVETVDVLALRAALDALPESPLRLTAAEFRWPRAEFLAAVVRPPAAAQPTASDALAGVSPGPSELAFAPARLPAEPGVVLDFVIVNTVPVPAGAISWWPAGGNAQDALAANPGTPYYSVTYGHGKVGQAFSFSPQGYVRVPNAPSLNPATGLTIEGWVWFPATHTGVNMPIASKDAPGARQYLLTKTTAGKVRAHVGIAGGAFYYTDGQTALAPETWHHVAMSWSAAAGQLRIYVNGVLDQTAAVSGTLLSTSQPLYLGGAPPWAYYWTGRLDELTLYDRALSETEIAAICAAGAAGKVNPQCIAPPAELAGWWPGDDSPYDFARLNHLTLLNGLGYAPAVVGSGWLYDGLDDGARAADEAAFNVGPADHLTVSAWVRAESHPTPYGVMTLVSKRQSPNPSSALGWELFLSDGRLGFQIADASGPVNFIASADLRDGGWHQVAVTLNRAASDGLRLYVDGVLVWTGDPTVRPGSLANAEPLRLGVHPQPGFNGYYKGSLDEVLIVRRALSASEISALYTAGCAGVCKGDSDGDGLTDLQEAFLGSSPTNPDTDGDGLDDATEVLQGRNPLLAGAVADPALLGLQVHTPLK